MATALLSLAACARTDIAVTPGLDAALVPVPDAGAPDTGLDVDPQADVPDPGPDEDVPVPIDVQPDGPIEPDLPPAGFCGDGVVQTPEACDDGEANSDLLPDACRTDCSLPSCGDRVVDQGEECDDGGADPLGVCGSNCRLIAATCTPCGGDEECGRPVDRCVRLPDGPACVIPCRTTGGCPVGLECDDAQAPEPLCVPVDKVCTGCFDPDGDGYGIGLECLGPDCNEADPRINPGAEEVCDDVDNNCNGQNDEGCPPDLIVHAETVVLSGRDLLFDRVEVRNGGVLRIEPYAGQSGVPQADDTTGCLRLQARIVVIRADGTVDASGAGGAGTGPGDTTGFGSGLLNTGAGGGGYGGRGGAGENRPTGGGRVYGTVDGPDIDQGSFGGNFEIRATGLGPGCDVLSGQIARGGAGGGCVELRAPDIVIEGRIIADGAPGQDAVNGATVGPVDGGGGGSGGGILLRGDRVRLARTSVLSAVGGRGGRGGTYRGAGGTEDCIGHGSGGGGGGRIKVFGVTGTERGEARSAGGIGGTGPQSNAGGGASGTTIIR
jgi:hypothetical protein